MEENGGAAQLESRPRVALLPTPGMGHLIPLVELAKRLVAHHGFSVTIITLACSASTAQSALLSSLPAAHISSLSLPPVPLDDLPPDAFIETTIAEATARSLPAIRLALSALLPDLVAVVVDLFGCDIFSVAADLRLPRYMFFPTNLLTLSVVFHLPALDAAATAEFRHLPEPIRLPGCVPIPGPDLLYPLQDRSNDAYRWVLHLSRRYGEAQGILVNSFDAIEPETAAVFRKAEPGRPPIYLVGPLTPQSKEGEEEAECLRWLDSQPTGSVLFVSFGSGGTLSSAQMAELALGLEMSGKRFLWVVRSPSDSGEASEAYFTVQSKADPFRFLPPGFAERTRDVGLLVPSWAPQVAVLNHAATGGFLCHCGWNSTLESVVAGVPMVTWPLFAEQRQNAVMLAQGARIALPPRPGEGGLVPREEVKRVVCELMDGEEGKAAKRRVAELQKAAISGLDDGGAAYKALAVVAGDWKNLEIINY